MWSGARVDSRRHPTQTETPSRSVTSLFLGIPKVGNYPQPASAGWHGGCLSSQQGVQYDHTGEPPVLEHEDQDRDPDPRDLCRPLLGGTGVGGEFPRGRASLGTDAEDLKAMRQRLKAVLLTYLVAQLLQFIAVEFDHLASGNADQVIVRLAAGDHFVIALLVIEK